MGTMRQRLGCRLGSNWESHNGNEKKRQRPHHNEQYSIKMLRWVSRMPGIFGGIPEWTRLVAGGRRRRHAAAGRVLGSKSAATIPSRYPLATRASTGVRPSVRTLRQIDHVVGPTTRPATHPFHHHVESAVPQAARELLIGKRRPHRQYPRRFEGGAGRGDASVSVERAVAVRRQRTGPVVDIKQRGVEAGAIGAKHLQDVAFDDLYARIVERP